MLKKKDISEFIEGPNTGYGDAPSDSEAEDEGSKVSRVHVIHSHP